MQEVPLTGSSSQEQAVQVNANPINFSSGKLGILPQLLQVKQVQLGIHF